MGGIDEIFREVKRCQADAHKQVQLLTNDLRRQHRALYAEQENTENGEQILRGQMRAALNAGTIHLYEIQR